MPITDIIENRADWVTMDLYNKVQDPWDVAEYHVEADRYFRYGVIKTLYWGIVGVLITGLCAIINYLVLGKIPLEDMKSCLLFVFGIILGGILGLSAVSDKFKKKLERGY